jgi:hypothetical protein
MAREIFVADSLPYGSMGTGKYILRRYNVSVLSSRKIHLSLSTGWNH